MTGRRGNPLWLPLLVVALNLIVLIAPGVGTITRNYPVPIRTITNAFPNTADKSHNANSHYPLNILAKSPHSEDDKMNYSRGKVVRVIHDAWLDRVAHHHELT